MKSDDRETHLLHKVLTNSRKGIHHDSWEAGPETLSLGAGLRCSMKKYILRGGKQEGVEVVEVDNGRLRFLVSPTRGMSVLKVESGDVRLGWDSPVREVVHPKFINLESRGGLGWLEGFNEWLVRCGMEWAGHPGTDRVRNNAGEEVEMDLTLHGKMANLPATEVEILVDAKPPHRIHVRGLVEERMFHGAKLALRTDISTEPGSDSFRVEDSITNEGAQDQEFQVIYHANFGPPLLGKGSRFFGPVKRVIPFNAHAARDVKTYDNFNGPRAGFVEQVYCLYPLADSKGRTLMLLQNAAGSRGVSMELAVQEMPYVTLWKNLAATEDGYVIGIEPGTGFPRTRRLEREAGRVPKLRSHETRRFTLDFSVLSNAAGIKMVRRRIRKIQGQNKTNIGAF